MLTRSAPAARLPFRFISVTLVAVALLPLIAATADAQGSSYQAPLPAYGSTLTFGTGLASIPVAWVSPADGDLFASISARAVGAGSYRPSAGGSLWDLTQSLELHLRGRISFGGSLYSTRTQQVGGFGQFLLVEQRTDRDTWVPAIAIGARNIGSSRYQDRFVTGERRIVDVLGDTGLRGGRGVYNGSPTAYLVATREFRYASGGASVTVGYGNGLFRETGGLGSLNSTRGTILPGLFAGYRYVVPAGEGGEMTFMLENNGFDWNAGLRFTLGHVSGGIYLTELEEAKGVPDNGALANFTKAAIAFSYNASLPSIVRGSTQRAEAAEARLELKRIEQEIEQRRLITRRLVEQLQTAARVADDASRKQQQLLIRQLDAEREALKDAQKRLDELGKKPPEPGGRIP
ncbi:MAG: hypothetical protein IT356_12330 [Gemmatimonadaceae bacterium]|nr:hypothetical protein [Gemmatimonadaceae bacterium]